MRPVELARSMELLIQAGQAFFVWGDPGVGKSQIARQVADCRYARDYGYAVDESGRVTRKTAGKTVEELAPTAPRPWLLDLRAVLLDPVDLMGLPVIDAKEGTTAFASPRILPRKGKGLLLFDELNRAPVMVQNACLQLVLDRRLSEYRLPDGWAVGAAGNYETDAGVQRMSDALASRFTHLTAETDPVQWTDWAARADLDPAVVAFIRWRPETLHKYDRKAVRAERAFPCPRTWEFASRIVRQQPQADVELGLLKGTLGDGVATEFAAFLRMYRELPDLDEIITHPQTATVPAGASSLYAVSSALAARASLKNVGAVMCYLTRFSSPEYAAVAILDMERRTPALAVTRPITDWKLRHPSLFL